MFRDFGQVKPVSHSKTEIPKHRRHIIGRGCPGNPARSWLTAAIASYIALTLYPLAGGGQICNGRRALVVE